MTSYWYSFVFIVWGWGVWGLRALDLCSFRGLTVAHRLGQGVIFRLRKAYAMALISRFLGSMWVRSASLRPRVFCTHMCMCTEMVRGCECWNVRLTNDMFVLAYRE